VAKLAEHHAQLLHVAAKVVELLRSRPRALVDLAAHPAYPALDRVEAPVGLDQEALEAIVGARLGAGLGWGFEAPFGRRGLDRGLRLALDAARCVGRLQGAVWLACRPLRLTGRLQ
jgi:hypothetical protein